MDSLFLELLRGRVEQSLLVDGHLKHLSATLAQQEKGSQNFVIIARNEIYYETERKIITFLAKLEEAFALSLQGNLLNVFVRDCIPGILLNRLKL